MLPILLLRTTALQNIPGRELESSKGLDDGYLPEHSSIDQTIKIQKRKCRCYFKLSSDQKLNFNYSNIDCNQKEQSFMCQALWKILHHVSISLYSDTTDQHNSVLNS